MTYLNRVYMAASMAAVQGHPDHGFSLKSLQHGRRALLPYSSDIRPLSGADHAAGASRDDDNRSQKDESFRQVMYLNCWGRG